MWRAQYINIREESRAQTWTLAIYCLRGLLEISVAFSFFCRVRARITIRCGHALPDVGVCPAQLRTGSFLCYTHTHTHRPPPYHRRPSGLRGATLLYILHLLPPPYDQYAGDAESRLSLALDFFTLTKDSALF